MSILTKREKEIFDLLVIVACAIDGSLIGFLGLFFSSVFGFYLLSFIWILLLIFFMFIMMYGIIIYSIVYHILYKLQ